VGCVLEMVKELVRLRWSLICFARLRDERGVKEMEKGAVRRENLKSGEGCGVPAFDEREASPPQPRVFPPQRNLKQSINPCTFPLANLASAKPLRSMYSFIFF
jgi:hypothetical protein